MCWAANETRKFFKVVLPAAALRRSLQAALGLGLAWFVIAVVGEMTGVPQGLGAVIMGRPYAKVAY